MKRTIAIFLICLMIFSILPINSFISLAKSYKPDFNVEYSKVTSQQIEDAMVYLKETNTDLSNEFEHPIDAKIFVMYGIIAYDKPYGDKKIPTSSNDLIRTEFRYLGKDYQGNPITNKDFPDDANSGIDLLEKKWLPDPANKTTWKNIDPGLHSRVTVEKGIINDGEPIPYTLEQIIAKQCGGSDYKLFIAIQSDWGFSKNLSVKLKHQGSTKVWYDTFVIPALAGDKTLQVDVSTPSRFYTIQPNENYIDIPVTVTSSLSTKDAYLETFIDKKWVTFEGNKIEDESYTFTKRIYKRDIGEGSKDYILEGQAEIKSVFPNDTNVIAENQTEITVRVAEDNLIVQLDLPKTAGINQEYEVKDISYIPKDINGNEYDIKSSTLEKKVGSATWETVTTWGKLSKTMTDSHPIKTTIQYRLTIELENGDTDDDTKTIEIIDGRSVDATADLELEEWTYEGHPAYARDVSFFDVEGETYSASRAYDEGVASNRFMIVENTPHDLDKISDTRAKIIFDESGFYNVKLRVRTQDNKELFDIEPIEVRDTPYINDYLGGTQKENRKQILNMSVAIHPDHPVESLWVELKDIATGETVHLTPTKQENSATIKTRNITENKETYFQNYTLEFLTKNDIEKEYQYKIYATDDKGDTATVTKTFMVYPDLPPEPQINLLDSYIRNESSNTAKIDVECDTVSKDGDQVERTWSVAFDTNHDNNFNDETYKNIASIGYNDLSFGTKKKIDLNKTGVGKFDMRLDVKEVWIEPTLEEYVTDADRLTAYTTKSSEVINIAPMVSLEPMDTYKEDVLILTTENDLEPAKSQKTTLDQYFKENGIDSKVTIADFENEQLIQDSDLRNYHLKLEQVMTDNSLGRWFGETVAIDNEKVYRIVPSVIVDKDTAQGPFTVEAWDIEKKAIAWTFTTTEEWFEFKQDDEGKYLYLVCEDRSYPKDDNKTILIDKKTGALVATLNFLVEGKPYYTEQGFYFLLDGAIKKLDSSTGTLKTIHHIGSEVSKIIGGKIHFIYSDDTTTYRGIFDPVDESVEGQYLLDKNIDNDGYKPYIVKDFDDYGAIFLSKQNSEDHHHDDIMYYNRVYDIDNQLVKKLYDTGFVDRYGDISYHWIKDEGGKVQYLYRSTWYHSNKKNKHRWYPKIYEIYGDKSYHHTQDVKGHGPGIMYTKYRNSTNEILFVNAGCVYYDWSDGDRARSYSFDLDTEDWNTWYLVCTRGDSEFTVDSHRYNAAYHTDDEQEINVTKNHLTLENNILRSLTQNAYFREEAQKNIIIIDNENTNNEDMDTLSKALNKLGAKVSIVTNGASNYLDKIKNAVSGEKITYTNMQSNLTNVANNINDDKETLNSSVIKVNGQGHSNATLLDDIELEAGKEYVYEYDIKYTQKGSMNNADIFNVEHDIQNIRTASNQVAVPTENEFIEDFEYHKDPNPFFNFSGNWSDSEYGSGKLKFSTDYSKGGTGREEISFIADEKAILSFDYGYIYDTRHYKKKFYMTEMKIWLDGIEQTPIELSTKGKDGFHFSKEIAKGNHVLKLQYKQYSRWNYQYAYIDNLKVKYINKKNDGSSDVGTLNKDSQGIKENEWQHISGEYRAPYETTQYTRISDKSKTIFENFSDNNLNFNMSMEGHHVSGGVFRPIYNHGDNFGNYIEADSSPYCEPRVTSVTFSVPSGHIGYFGVWADGWHEDPGDQFGEIPALGSGDIEGYGYRPGEYITPWELYTRKYASGTHTVHFYSYSYYSKKKHRWDDGYLKIDNMFLKLQPVNYDNNTQFIDDTGNVYAKSKEYKGDSTLKLGYTSTADSEFLIKNLKIYRLENGKKILWRDYGTMTQEMLQETFTTATNNAQITIDNDTQPVEPEEPALIYKKGELVAYNIYYNDYEGDQSKREYWQYTHTPYNDKLHPKAGQILSDAIDRFWVDGKYVVKHWQEDSTGVTDYDKVSNKEEITFYVLGNSTAAPEVTYIKTIPGAVKEGQDYKIEIGVDDEDLDDLDTIIELYKKNQLIYTYNENDVSPTDGIYPPVISGKAPTAEVGKYTIVATARDDTGVGMRSYEFSVVSEGKVEGEVHHVEQWNINRKKYNLAKTGNEEKPRGYNVFWSGERFVLRSETEGKPNRVHVEILNEGYETDLTTIDDRDTWEGWIWDESMMVENNFVIIKWGRYAPETLTFHFTAYFDSGTTRTHNAQIIVDHQDPYWRLHRKY